MVLPPPNVTGQLHLGHALTVTIEDAIARHHRMHGVPVQWLPGFDHAGIATQTVVERQLWKERGQLRKDLSREQFLAHCEAWAKKNSTTITEQLKRLGATLDWDNGYYTLDQRFSRAVTQAFVRLNSDGLIRREKRLINWCPLLQSSLSEQEVDKVAVEEPTEIEIPAREGGKRKIRVGVMHRVRYELVRKDGESLTFLEVATTRPETIFADVALAVHPDDARYGRLVGERVYHPLIRQRTLPVIADEAVQPDKGTGVLKITPAHDLLDETIARRHLKELDSDALTRCCIDENGNIQGVPGYANMDRFDARIKVVKDLTEVEAYGGEIIHRTSQIHLCSRTGDVVEPRLASQWFLDTQEMHDEARKAFDDGRIQIHPAYEKSNIMEWLKYQEPWCLSRQLLWGHRIPAFRRDKDAWIVAESVEAAAKTLGMEPGEFPEQDKDVLDTWFSSALVPLVTAGWPEKTPTSPPLYVMETGHDILGFWVARMVILTQRLTGGVVPFTRVLLHGMIRDYEGRKMSKSLGNVVDPLDVVDGISLDAMLERLRQSNLPEQEIGKASANLRARFPEGMQRCGADALRFALLQQNVTGVDVYINVVELADMGRRFCNKLWNLAAYVKKVKEASADVKLEEDYTPKPEDLWLRSRVAATGRQMDEAMEANAPHLAFAALRRLFLDDICSVYLESTKQALWKNDVERCAVIAKEFKTALGEAFLRLSTFMPFISEHLYKKVVNGDIYDRTVKVNEAHIDEALERRVTLAFSVASTIRSLREQLQLPTHIVLQGVLHSNESGVKELKEFMKSLSGLELEAVVKGGEPPTGYTACSVPGHSATLSESHRAAWAQRLVKQLEAARVRKESFESRLQQFEESSKKEGYRETPKKAAMGARFRHKAEGARLEMEKLQKLIDWSENTK